MGWQSCTDKDSFTQCNSGCPVLRNIDFDLNTPLSGSIRRKSSHMLIHGTDGSEVKVSL